jgi:diguanylate cyclase (GGDEF)-like protein
MRRQAAADVAIVGIGLSVAGLTWARGGILPADCVLALMVAATMRIRSQREALAEARRDLEKERREARTDRLTRIPNRDLLNEHVDGLDANDRWTLVLMDLDRFKRVNDTYGHDAGDQLLKRFAGLLAETTRGIGLAARISGDEFALVLPSGFDDVEGLFADISDRLADVMRSDHRFELVDLSAGVARNKPGLPVRKLKGRADLAMYHAKLSEERCVRWAEGMQMPEQTDQRRRVRPGKRGT